ncbi:hypothetical protein GCM10027610_025920 [Dactylosporangium cerinum]
MIRGHHRVQALHEQPHHPITDHNIGHPGTDVDDRPRTLQTQWSRTVRIQIQRVQNITEIDP